MLLQKKINQTIASAINPNFSQQELKNAVKIMRQMIEEDKKSGRYMEPQTYSWWVS